MRKILGAGWIALLLSLAIMSIGFAAGDPLKEQTDIKTCEDAAKKVEEAAKRAEVAARKAEEAAQKAEQPPPQPRPPVERQYRP